MVVWLSAGCGSAAATDKDRDKLPDSWERKYKFSTTQKSDRADSDRDGLSNLREYRLKLHPRRRDTDRDGLRDGDEVRRYKTNPRKRDTDGDGQSDGDEVRAGTDPRVRDGAASGPAAVGPRPADATAGTPSSQAAPAPPRCDLHAGRDNLTAQLEAAPADARICLAAGDYGRFVGLVKPGRVTLAPEPGATVTIAPVFNGAANLTLQGMQIPGAELRGATRDISIVDSTFTGPVYIDGLVDSNVELAYDAFLNIDAPTQKSIAARVSLAYGGDAHSGVTIRNSLLAGGDADGVQSGVGVNILDNEFRDILEKGGPNHTDAIQLTGAPGSVVRGNYIHDTSTGIVAYGGLTRAVIEHNVVDLVAKGRRPWGIELYSDNGSTVRHNTVVYGRDCLFNTTCGSIDLNSKAGLPAGRGTVVADNIATTITVGNGASGTQERNLLRERRGAGAGNIVGAPVFEGGDRPGGYLGYRLASGSPGTGTAAGGADAGIAPGR